MSVPQVEQAVRAAQLALDSGDLKGAWRALGPLEARASRDPQVAAAWLALLRVAAGHPQLVQRVRAIIDGFRTYPELVCAGCDALIRHAELVAPDEPPPKGGSAFVAAELAQRCLESLSESDRQDPNRLGYLQISLANALRLCHLYDRSGAAYRAALKRGPERGWWWFNYGLLHKARGAFDEGLEANETALSLLGPRKPLLWNIAICATALGRGKRALWAYDQLGIPCGLNAVGMPEAAEMPPVQLRVATVGGGHAGPAPVPDRAVSFELLWVSPLSPCHGVVQTPTYRQASVDYGDVVLWDAVPVGTVELEGRKLPRFPLLAVLRAGDEHRFRFVALQRKPGALDSLKGGLPEGGRLFVHRTDGDGEVADLVYGKVILPADADLPAFRAAFEVALRAAGQAELVMPGLLEALGDTAAAGKAHTMWRGLERTVEKRRGDR